MSQHLIFQNELRWCFLLLEITSISEENSHKRLFHFMVIITTSSFPKTWKVLSLYCFQPCAHLAPRLQNGWLMEPCNC